jgi:hypothetical protein
MAVLEALLLAAAGAGAFFVSTIVGGGGASLIIPLVAVLAGAGSVAPVVTVATLVANPTRVLLFRRHIRWDIVRWYLPGALVGGLAGAWSFAVASAEWILVALGVFLATTPLQYAFGRRRRTFPMRPWAFLPVGLAVSYVSGLVGAGGPLLNPFYLNAGALKEEMIGTKSFNSFFMHVTKIGGYTALGAMEPRGFLLGLAAGLGAAGGSALARPCLARLSAARFRQLVIVAMTVAGLLMLWQQRGLLLP